jgi:hypothetical protein
MTFEEKTKKLAQLDSLLAASATEAPRDRGLGISSIGFHTEDIQRLADNLRRQLAGGPPPTRAYHISRKLESYARK